MTGIPDFTKVDFATFAPPASLPSGSVEPWFTPEGIAVRPAYGPADLAGPD